MTSVPATARPCLSLIVPTHNRRASLERLLAALLSQSRSLDDVEVVVVADGCCDDTVARLRAREDLPLTVVECTGVGPAGARNAGAKAAYGDILVFLDDDIVPGRDWLAAHEAAHILHPGTVVIGPYRPVPNPQERAFRRAAQLWWDQHFDELQSPGHRIHYTDILTGNISIPAEIWHRLNGLDERLRAHEDYDFGLRLLSADVPIVVAPRAAGLHYEHETMQIDGALRRAQQEGHADAILAEKHPSIRNDLKLVAWWRWPSRASHAKNRLIFEQGGLLKGLARWAERRLPTLERWNLLPQHRAVLRYLQSFWYIRGVAGHFDTFAEWRAFALQPDLEPEGQVLSIDLQPGLPAAEAELDTVRPACVELRYGAQVIGCLPRTAGAEPWVGRHLRGQIPTVCGLAYLRKLAADGKVTNGPLVVRDRLDAGLMRSSLYFSNRKPPGTFLEQDEQWRRALIGRTTRRRFFA